MIKSSLTGCYHHPFIKIPRLVSYGLIISSDSDIQWVNEYFQVAEKAIVAEATFQEDRLYKLFYREYRRVYKVCLLEMTHMLIE